MYWSVRLINASPTSSSFVSWNIIWITVSLSSSPRQRPVALNLVHALRKSNACAFSVGMLIERISLSLADGGGLNSSLLISSLNSLGVQTCPSFKHFEIISLPSDKPNLLPMFVYILAPL